MNDSANTKVRCPGDADTAGTLLTDKFLGEGAGCSPLRPPDPRWGCQASARAGAGAPLLIGADYLSID